MNTCTHMLWMHLLCDNMFICSGKEPQACCPVLEHRNKFIVRVKKEKGFAPPSYQFISNRVSTDIQLHKNVNSHPLKESTTCIRTYCAQT